MLSGHGLPATDRPHWATARDGTRYVRVSIYPTTPDELRTCCRSYGDAAVVDLEWACVIRWIMGGATLRNAPALACSAVLMMQEHDRIRLGWPRHDGIPWPNATIDRLNPEARREAERIAAETLDDWREAGCPCLDPDKIKRAYQYLIGCPAFRTRHVGPADEPHKETE